MKSISVRFSDEAKKKLDEAAKADGRSINSFIVKAVAEKIEAQK